MCIAFLRSLSECLSATHLHTFAHTYTHAEMHMQQVTRALEREQQHLREIRLAARTHTAAGHSNNNNSNNSNKRRNSIAQHSNTLISPITQQSLLLVPNSDMSKHATATRDSLRVMARVASFAITKQRLARVKAHQTALHRTAAAAAYGTTNKVRSHLLSHKALNVIMVGHMMYGFDVLKTCLLVAIVFLVFAVCAAAIKC